MVRGLRDLNDFVGGAWGKLYFIDTRTLRKSSKSPSPKRRDLNLNSLEGWNA